MYFAYPFFRNTQRSAYLEDTCFDSDTDDDGLLHVEDSALDHLKESREDSLDTVLRLSLFLAFLDILSELIEQVIDNVCCEDSDSVVIRKGLCIGHHLHIKGKDRREFLLNVLTLQ